MRASVIIRARDEAPSIATTLDLLAAQTVAHDVVVVDSGSTDGTQAIARERGAHVVELPAEDFSFGRSLNVGVRAALALDPSGSAVGAGSTVRAGSTFGRATDGPARAARAAVVVALSAHASPCTPAWLERMVSHFEDPAVACACGEAVDERFRPLTGPARQDLARLEAWPFWGYSNAAGGFRASLWERRPFREDLPGSEDREWSRWALGEGHLCVLDPALVVDHDHSRDPLRVCFERYRREHAGFAAFLDLPPYRAHDLAREWWCDQGGHRSRARARLDPRRAARLAGKWWGRRAAPPVPAAASLDRSVPPPHRPLTPHRPSTPHDHATPSDPLDDAVWEAASNAEPDRLAQRRDWLLARVVPGELVADVGAGLGHFAAALAGAGCGVVALDSSAVAVRLARERHPDLDIRHVEADGKLPLEDSSVDVVWGGEVIEHVADTAAWLSEVRRALRSGGRLLLSTPYHGRVKTAALALARHEEHFDPRGPHLRFYTRQALTELLLDFGFEDVRLSTLGGPPLLRAILLAQARRARFAAG